MYIAAGGPGLKQSGLAAFWFGEALVRPCLERLELGPVVDGSVMR